MRKTFARRRTGNRPTRVWVGISGQFAFTAVTVTTTAIVAQLQAPADLSNLTSDPPEDLTVLRIIGDFSVVLSAATANWTLALLVQDTAWTPTTPVGDADKRILWSQTYESGANAVSYLPPGVASEAGVLAAGLVREATRLDISPKVRIEAGKALYLVAYENLGAAALTVFSSNMRMLFQRSGRR